MVGLFTLFGAVLWYLLDNFKRWLNGLREAKHFNVNDVVYDLVLWVTAVVVGMLLAIQFKLDAFILASQLMDNVVQLPDIEPSFIGYIFGGLLLASGSGFLNGLLKALGKRDTVVTAPVIISEGEAELGDSSDIQDFPNG